MAPLKEVRTERFEVSIPVDGRYVRGEMHVPAAATGIVVFAHGSGSSRHSPRNQAVARELQITGLATLLMDLLSEDEAEDRDNVFDIALLASRLLHAAHWLENNPPTWDLRLGYFGASTGAAAALLAAAREPARVSAIVSRGGRPDMASPWLAQVKAPTLLIVGERDSPVLEWNQEAYRHIKAEKKLIVVPGATHLFEEPGALHAVALHACRWFAQFLFPEREASDRGRKVG